MAYRVLHNQVMGGWTVEWRWMGGSEWHYLGLFDTKRAAKSAAQFATGAA